VQNDSLRELPAILYSQIGTGVAKTIHYGASAVLIYRFTKPPGEFFGSVLVIFGQILHTSPKWYLFGYIDCVITYTSLLVLLTECDETVPGCDGFAKGDPVLIGVDQSMHFWKSFRKLPRLKNKAFAKTSLFSTQFRPFEKILISYDDGCDDKQCLAGKS
jgi:hypothetical protein